MVQSMSAIPPMPSKYRYGVVPVGSDTKFVYVIKLPAYSPHFAKLKGACVDYCMPEPICMKLGTRAMILEPK
jgi:hypothetical protein